MTNQPNKVPALPINTRQLKRQAKLLLQEIRSIQQNPATFTLSQAQEAISRI